MCDFRLHCVLFHAIKIFLKQCSVLLARLQPSKVSADGRVLDPLGHSFMPVVSYWLHPFSRRSETSHQKSSRYWPSRQVRCNVILTYTAIIPSPSSAPVLSRLMRSWIGLKMVANWDNSFGEWMGVGNFTRAKTKLPSRKDLAKIMKFRAFAALVPLCAQKLGDPSASTSKRGGWRQKDTDITYSG